MTLVGVAPTESKRTSVLQTLPTLYRNTTPNISLASRAGIEPATRTFGEFIACLGTFPLLPYPFSHQSDALTKIRKRAMAIPMAAIVRIRSMSALFTNLLEAFVHPDVRITVKPCQ